MTTLSALMNLNNNGILKFQEGLVGFADSYRPFVPLSGMFNPDGSLVTTLGTTYGIQSAGTIDPTGVTMPTAITSDKQAAWQTSQTVRDDISVDDGTVTYSSLETNNTTIAIARGLPLSTLPAQGTAQLGLDRAARSVEPQRRMYVFGHDLKKDIFMIFGFPNAVLSARADRAMSPTANFMNGATFDALFDQAAGTAERFWLGGPGWLAQAHGGFAQSIAVTPPTATLSLAGTKTQQLAVVATYPDATTTDITTSATYVSTDPSKATVSAGGLVTAIAVGSVGINVTAPGGAAALVQVTVTA